MSRDFVCLWKNIKPDQKFLDGSSSWMDGEQLAKQLQNGTAPQNVATYFCTAEGAVLHGVRGYWRPTEYLQEMDFALRLSSSRPEERANAYLEASKALPAGDLRRPVYDEFARDSSRRLENLTTCR